MSESHFLRVITFIFAFVLTSVAGAQVPVEVSNQKIVSGGRVYYMHEVQKNQTLYSISRAYKVTIDAITRENVIPSSGIQTGQVLRIPSAEPVQASQNRQPAENRAASTAVPQPENGRPGSTVSYGGIRISREKIVTSGKVYFLHEVQKGQTLYSIAKAYQVTILDIDRENSIPAGGIQTGQVLRIPARSSLVAELEESNPATDTKADRPAPARETKPQSATAPAQMPRQESSSLPHQESTRQTSSMPHQEQVNTGTYKPSEKQTAGEVSAPGRETTATVPDTQTKTQVPANKEQTVKQSQPEKKRIHKVQKGESLADIARKYNITTQELKQANKGVIFAMPDMRLVIPAPADPEK
jgi:LysM repeat protein